MSRFVLNALVMFGLLVPTEAANWPQWRGPNLNGSSDERGLPETFSKTENVLWTAPLPGASGATPAIWNDSVFVSTPDADKNLLLLCLDAATGAERWQTTIAEGDRTEGRGNMASPSPITDGQAVYILYGTGDLAALDFHGKVLWQRNLGKDFGKFAIMWLYGSSPLLHEGKLYVQVLQRDPPTYPHALDDKPARDSYLLCLDPKTGKDIWRQVRKTDAIVESQEAYSTPVPYTGNRRTEIIVVGGDYVTGHDAETGAEQWRCGGLNPKKDQWWRIVTSAVTVDGLIIAAPPKREPLMAIRAGGKGDITSSHVAWTFKEAPPDVCTPLVYQKKLFVLDGDKQVLTCLEPATGEKRWSGNLGVRETFRGSPTGADGKIYCLSERGTVVVASAGDDFKVLATVRLDEEPSYSTVAVSNGRLFIRTAKNLYCVGGKK